MRNFISIRTLCVIVAIGSIALLSKGAGIRSQRETECGIPYIDENGNEGVVGQPAAPSKLSLIRLAAAPELFHRKRVVTQGFLVLAFEHTALYLSQEDATHGLTYNGLWIDLNKRCADRPKQPTLKDGHFKYVTMEGTFDKVGRGHLGARFAGTLEDVVLHAIHRELKNVPSMHRVGGNASGRPH